MTSRTEVFYTLRKEGKEWIAESADVTSKHSSLIKAFRALRTKNSKVKLHLIILPS